MVDKNQVEGLLREVLDPQVFQTEGMDDTVVTKLSHEFRYELENDFKNKGYSKVIIEIRVYIIKIKYCRT